MTERELLVEVLKICDSLNPPVRWVHLSDTAASTAARSCPWVRGWPDLLVGTAAMCWRELKAGSTPLTAAQDDWLDTLEAAGGDADIWGEADLHDGSIRAEILALNGIKAEREPWMPEGATAAEIAHRRALYTSAASVQMSMPAQCGRERSTSPAAAHPPRND